MKQQREVKSIIDGILPKLVTLPAQSPFNECSHPLTLFVEGLFWAQPILLSLMIQHLFHWVLRPPHLADSNLITMTPPYIMHPSVRWCHFTLLTFFKKRVYKLDACNESVLSRDIYGDFKDASPFFFRCLQTRFS